MTAADEPQQPAGPVAGNEGALRAGASSAPPSPTPPAGETAEQEQSQAVEQDLDALLADTQREREEYLELAKRTKADFENYRKRMAAENQAALVRGKSELASSLLGVIDNLERALAAAEIDPEADELPDEALAQGIVLTYRELCRVLNGAGVESVDPTGERFDPNLHEALSKQPAKGAEPGTVIEVMQKGYRLGEQLIRPARVVVAE